MAMTALLALGVTLSIALGWRRRVAPAAGAIAGIVLLLAGGLIDGRDLGDAGRALWRPALTIGSIMLMTTCAQRLGLLDRLAALIEPTTRGPARRAFRAVFVLSALAAAVLSNDGAILVLTPTVVALLRQVYPRRHVRFVVPFAFAVFCAAGVAPLVTSNPMNLMVADRAGIGFNAYAVRMIPVALVGWVTTYLALGWVFRRALADEAPALGPGPVRPPALGPAAWLVVAALALVLAAYPVVSFLDGPLWAVALVGAIACVTVTRGAGVPARAIAGGPSWEIVPFLAGVVLLATGLERVGVVGVLADLFAAAPAPIAVVGAVAASGAAVLDNHAMGLLGWLAIERTGGDPALVLAALVGGDLGPRLLPIGSLAGLLWLGALRRLGVEIGVARFIRVGALVTVPTLITTLATLWLVTRR
jgi:arsenical pump membrane protein